MQSAISCLFLLFASLGSTVYIHIEDGLCVDLYDHTNMGSPVSSLPICGETLASSCGTVGDGSVYANNPYNCKKCGTVTIYDNFTYNIQQAQEDSKYQCQGIFTIPEDYGDAYYRNKRLYDAFGSQIGDTSCEPGVTWGGNLPNPWNHWLIETDPSATPCPSSTPPPAPTVTCYYGANPDACPEQYEQGWCYCNDEAALYPILSGDQPCGYTVMPTTTTTTPACTATGEIYYKRRFQA